MAPQWCRTREQKKPAFRRASWNKAGRAGFEPAVEFITRQPLSRRSHSTTLAPPRVQMDIKISAEGEGFEPTVGCPTPVFKTGALNHSAILPGGNRFSLRSKIVSQESARGKNLFVFKQQNWHYPVSLYHRNHVSCIDNMPKSAGFCLYNLPI